MNVESGDVKHFAAGSGGWGWVVGGSRGDLYHLSLMRKFLLACQLSAGGFLPSTSLLDNLSGWVGVGGGLYLKPVINSERGRNEREM